MIKIVQFQKAINKARKIIRIIIRTTLELKNTLFPKQIKIQVPG
jgi:hypothetical protein